MDKIIIKTMEKNTIFAENFFGFFVVTSLVLSTLRLSVFGAIFERFV